METIVYLISRFNDKINDINFSSDKNWREFADATYDIDRFQYLVNNDALDIKNYYIRILTN